ncbi:uncharacterized protein EI90DRAFT_3156469 [Cantharellus anzutake]|nr:uncharacterized protein EI90DRAFT_3156469 [Cantharellus anzutake]KAF8326889.1 hypothetical protein EI90DRAFT_3156469 [Cantharellus anzutake]
MYGYPQPGVPPSTEKLTTLFVGGISAGVTDDFMNSLLSACGPLQSFKRLTNPNGKPQGFGFAEFEEPDSVQRALTLLHGKTIPAVEPGAPNKSLVVRADDKTKAYLQMYESQRIRTDQDDAADMTAETLISSIIDQSAAAARASGNAALNEAQAAVPPHLRDLQESDLPENQRGLVISEIALFRDKAMKRDKEVPDTTRMASRAAGVGGFSRGAGPIPSGPKERVWGKPQGKPAPEPSQPSSRKGSWDRGPISRDPRLPTGFVKGHDAIPAEDGKSDEELERERKATRRREEDESFRDRERRYEAREDQRLASLERLIMRTQAAAKAKEIDRVEIRERLHVWDDDESDELFYTDCARWRSQRTRHLAIERAADERSREIEARQAEHLRVESEAFLARQNAEIQSLAEEQRKAGMLLDDKPIKLSIGGTATGAGNASDANKSGLAAGAKPKVTAPVFGAEDEDDDTVQKKRAPLQKIDFGGVEASGRQERLETLKASVKKDKESVFKAKIRWDGITDELIEGKLERLIKHKMIDYLGELDDDDLVMFVIEHLKDHKPASKLVEGLEPVLVEEAEEFVLVIWRQLVFESLSYSEGMETDNIMVE